MVDDRSHSYLSAWANGNGHEKTLSGEKTSNCTGGIAVQPLLTGPRLEKPSGCVVKKQSSTASVTRHLSLLRERSDVLNQRQRKTKLMLHRLLDLAAAHSPIKGILGWTRFSMLAQ